MSALCCIKCGAQLTGSNIKFCSAACRNACGPIPVAVRFWRHVKQGSEKECWNWTGCAVKGYGAIGAGSKGGKLLKAARVSYEMAHGPIPARMKVCHTCDNPLCVNPAHLFLGSDADNARDKMEKGRWGGSNQHLKKAGVVLTSGDIGKSGRRPDA